MLDNVFNWYKLSNFIYKSRIPFLPRAITYFTRIIFGCYIPYSAEIGSGTKFGYGGLGVVVHSECIIGRNCIISQGVTLGGTGGKFGVPKLGDKVFVGAGAKLIGPIIVGDNVVIGANAVVIKDVPSNTLVVGAPARIIKQNINIKEYISQEA